MYDPRYSITNKILKSIGAVEAAKEVIENAPLVPFYEKQFQTEAMIRTVHHGTHIEGNDLNFEQTKKVLEGEAIFARDRDIQEVINYRNVVKLLNSFLERDAKYSLDMLLDIHRETVKRLIDESKTGAVRTSQVIIREEGTGKIVFQPPPAQELPYLLEDFFEWINSSRSREIHPVLKAGIAHYILVSIHPFIEGNGRTTRAFANLILMKEGYDVNKFFSLEEHIDEDLASYYAAFSTVDSQSPNLIARDLTPFLEYFVEVVAIELTKIKNRVRKLSVDQHLKGRLGTQVALSERQMKLVEYISQKGSGKMKDLRDVLSMVSEDTVLRDLNDMLEKGVLVKKGKTKASRYLLSSSK